MKQTVLISIVVIVTVVIAFVSCMSMSGMAAGGFAALRNLASTGSTKGRQGFPKGVAQGSVLEAASCNKDTWCRVGVLYYVAGQPYSQTATFLTDYTRNYKKNQKVTVCYDPSCPGYDPVIC